MTVGGDTKRIGAGGGGDGFLTGLMQPFLALRFMVRHPALWARALVPAALTLILLTALFVTLLFLSDDLTRAIWAPPEGPWAGLAWQALRALVFLGVLVVGAVAVPGLVASPFNDLLSERTERLAGGASGPEPPFSWRRAVTDVGRALLDEAAKVALLLLGHAVLLPLLLVPVAGALLHPALAWLWTVTWLAAEYLEVPMGRHGARFADVRRLVRAHLPLALGFGTGTFLLLAVPLLNFLFVPVSVVAGTLLWLHLQPTPATED